MQRDGNLKQLRGSRLKTGKKQTVCWLFQPVAAASRRQNEMFRPMGIDQRFGQAGLKPPLEFSAGVLGSHWTCNEPNDKDRFCRQDYP